MAKLPTHADIAKVAGVSQATVSLALQAHPRIPPTTQQRIQAIARKIGYRPNPMLSALAAYRKGNHAPRYQGTLAWINTWPKPHQLREQYGDYWAGASERCRELGYQLEEFFLGGPAITCERLSRILRARGIQGLLLPPQARSRAHLNFPWHHFSAITFGYSLARPQLHLVSSAQSRCSVLAIRKLRSYGYRRIGLALSHGADERTDHNFTSGYLAEQLRLKSREKIPPLLLEGSRVRDCEELARWYTRHRPEVILTHTDEVADWMDELGFGPRDYNLVLLAHEKHARFAGVDQNNHLIGRTSVDLLSPMISRNEKGIPRVPLRTLVEGKWVDGPSVRPRIHFAAA
jgi:LacI family repressor for deo operon, udp, cdd, tsx, nupC, and nupG